MVDSKKVYSIKKYMLLLIVAITAVFWIAISGLLLVGLDCQGTLMLSLLMFPYLLFLSLYGFYKGLVKHYGLQSKEKLFFDSL